MNPAWWFRGGPRASRTGLTRFVSEMAFHGNSNDRVRRGGLRGWICGGIRS